MGREVRRVAADWQHPMDEYKGHHKPLYDGKDYKRRADDFMEIANAQGLQAAINWHGQAPDVNDYMPQWTADQATHLMMYEDTSEGTPISPAFATPEELARWLADNGASAFGNMTATYEQWLDMVREGWAPSAVITGGVMESGVAAIGASK